jgi:hypothetical protein
LQLWLQFALIYLAKIDLAIAWLFLNLFFAHDKLLLDVFEQLLSNFTLLFNDQILDLYYGLTEEIFTDNHLSEQERSHGVQMSIAC